MLIEVKVPVLPESITEATLVNWHKKAGDPVSRDENLIDVETDKVVLELPAPIAPPTVKLPPDLGARPEQRVPMSRLRQRVAERLVQSQSTAAILTTFNEVNMGPVIELRNRYKERFEKDHGVKLGFMGFFVKAAVHALKKFPAVNASIDGADIIS